MVRLVQVIAVVVLLGSAAVVSAFTVEGSVPGADAVDTRVYDPADLNNWIQTPTEGSTATSTPAVATHSVWHEPTNHEHGDVPPAWAETWSMAQLGHGIVFGGDEATPNEDVMKHEAFKGFRIQADGFDVYLRYHAQSNPHGRSGRFHSYEIYAKDPVGGISFWQGWLDFGAVPERRYSHTDTTTHEINVIQDIGEFIFSGDVSRVPLLTNYREDWYTRNTTADWSWTVEIDILDPTTVFSYGEHLDNPHDQVTWDVTGEYGLDRVVRVRWFGPDANYDAFPGRNASDPRGWFCATPKGDITARDVSGPAACEGDLPQFIAETMVTVPDPKPGLYARRTYSCDSCELPN